MACCIIGAHILGLKYRKNPAAPLQPPLCICCAVLIASLTGSKQVVPVVLRHEDVSARNVLHKVAGSHVISQLSKSASQDRGRDPRLAEPVGQLFFT